VAADSSSTPRVAALRLAAESLGEQLDCLSTQLLPHERELLGLVLTRAMSPIERMRYLEPVGLLTELEVRILGALLPRSFEE
jgi:hypothetical protein